MRRMRGQESAGRGHRQAQGRAQPGCSRTGGSMWLGPREPGRGRRSEGVAWSPCRVVSLGGIVGPRVTGAAWGAELAAPVGHSAQVPTSGPDTTPADPCTPAMGPSPQRGGFTNAWAASRGAGHEKPKEALPVSLVARWGPESAPRPSWKLLSPGEATPPIRAAPLRSLPGAPAASASHACPRAPPAEHVHRALHPTHPSPTTRLPPASYNRILH